MQEMHDEASVVMKAMTAEVQTIVMNNRQVTLSVARQLDQVSLYKMEPWGRIALWQNKNDNDEGVVIGVSDGQLVTALIPNESETRDEGLSISLPPKVGFQVCPDVEAKYFHLEKLKIYTSRAILLVHERNVWWHKCADVSEEMHREFAIDDLDLQIYALAKIRDYRARLERHLEAIRHAKRLPKIVLAGLK